MPKRIDIGTDIATIGLWDPTRERHDLKNAKFADFKSGLESEARQARLFFINTFSDGSYLTDIYVDAEPDADRLALYSTCEREFLISCESGRLVAGGVEDFVSASKQITSADDQFDVAPGLYALRLYEVVDERLSERLRTQIGVEDYAYYESRFAGVPWGCLLFVIAAGFLVSQLWLVAAGVFALWLAYVVVRSRVRAADTRLQEIAGRIKAFEDQFPPFLYVLRSVVEPGDVQGGWHNME